MATNLDATYPVPGGLVPGSGAIAAAVATASGRTPEVAGKPEAPMAALVRERLGSKGVVVGDRPSSDGRLAEVLGWPFALVLSGVTAEVAPPGGEAIPNPPPPFVAAHLGELAPSLIAAFGSVRSAPWRRERPMGAASGFAYPAPVTARRRLDTELVRRGLLGSRQQAAEAIAAGRVMVAGSPAERAARLVDPAEPIHVSGDRPQFVSRGGHKLAAALDRFGVIADGRRALDAGASTGGFTDCLLQAGAAHVVAVDVGRGQLAWSLRGDARVTVLERTNVRGLDSDAIGGPVDLAVADLSFISLLTVAPALVRCTTRRRGPGPPREAPVRGGAGAGRQGRRGARPDRPPRRAPRECATACATPDCSSVDVMASPLRGADGNVEFLVRCEKHGPIVAHDAARRVRRRRERARMTARAIGIVPHPLRAEATELAKHAAARLIEHGINVRVPGPTPTPPVWVTWPPSSIISPRASTS